MNKFRTTSNLTKTLILSVLMLTSGFLFTSGMVHRTIADDGGTNTGLVQTPATFTNYELAGNQFTADHSNGVSCPNTATVESQKCYSTQAEPAIRADRSGNFYGSSESVFIVIGGQTGGTYAWKSIDGGSHFTTLSLPNTVTVPTSPIGVSPAGGDTDIAVAPVKNSNGFYNVYVSSLHNTLADISVSTSTDGGASFTDHVLSSSVPIDDREWVAADGANKICLSYHAESTTGDIIVDCSSSAGLVFEQHATAFDATHAPLFLALNNKIGNLAIDPRNHVIYQVFSSVSDTSEIVPCVNGCNFHTVWVGVSIDGGKTFTDYIVHDDTTHNSDYGHSFVNVSVDKAGTVYAVYSDDYNIFYSYSKTFGQTWTGPFKINQSPSNTAIFPWSTAGHAGQLDVVWYGTSYTNGATVPTNFPPYPSTVAAWHVYFAQNVQASTPGTAFIQMAASGVIHYGDVCELGTGCSSSQNRDLLDDFGVAASPTTGKAAIIYTSDQYVNSALEPANTFGSRHCTPSGENNVNCSHTDIANQLTGSTINQKPPRFETDEEDFEETNVSNNGNPSPEFNMEGTDTGTTAITSITATVSGLPLALSWTNAFPLQPGQTTSASTTSVPVGLVLAVGDIYPVNITTTFADGTSETQTTNAIYTLGAGIGL